jgi:hypothetical protein
VGIDPDSLQTQALSQRGTDLFRANITLANSLGIDLSPTLMIEGEDRTEWLGNPALTRLLCAADDARCKNLPTCSRDADCSAATGQVALCENPNKPQARCTSYTPIPFDLHAIHTNACPSCDMENFLETTRKLFPAAKIHHHDAAGDSGAFLAQKYSLQVFPAYILSADFVRSPRFARVRHMVESRADAYALSPRLSGRSFWPRRLPQPGQLELFLPAWDIESEVQFLHLGETTPLQIHYLLDGAPAGAQSEFAVRACIGMHSPERLASFVATRNLERRRGSALGQWLNAARDSGVLSAAIDHCIHTGSGDRLLARGAARADSLDLRGDAPAVLVQNQLLVRRPQPAEVVQIWQEKR